MSSGSRPAPLRIAAMGAGFWARFQLSAWREVPGVEIAALCDVERAKAEKMAHNLGIPRVFSDPLEMLQQVRPQLVDVITSPSTHADMVRLAASQRVPVVVQKPMALSLREAEELVATCRSAGVPFFVHENWRWQRPLRELQRVLAQGEIGQIFRARITMVSGFPIFANQPYLKDLPQFLLADMGVHILDVARLLFGEAESVYSQTCRVHEDIRGEDVATVLLRTRAGATVVCEMGYAGNALERDRFPETYVFVEGAQGSAELAPDFWIRVTTAGGTVARRCPPPRYAWADPAYDVVHASMPACHENVARAVRGEGAAETTGEDNVKTLRLVFGAYDSAATNQVVAIPPA